MPKATMEFSLPEEKSEFVMANQGQDYYCILVNLKSQLRSWEKYGHDFMSADEAISVIYSDLLDELNQLAEVE